MDVSPIQVISFGGGFNLPLWAAQQQGLFARHGVSVALTFTADSRQVFTGLMDGGYHVAITALDNIVAYQEGHTELVFDPPSDFFAFMGSDEGFLSLLAAPGIASFQGLEGRAVSIDDPANGFSIVLREMLERNGIAPDSLQWERAGGTDRRYAALVEGRHAATMLRTPFDLMAMAQGLNRLATTRDTVGPYMGIVGAARRSWAAANEAGVVGFIRAYRDAVRWLQQPDNRAAAQELLIANVKQMSPELARMSCEALLDPHTGFFNDVRLDARGVASVLALRSKWAGRGEPLTDASRYVDESYWRQAMAG